MMRLIAQTVQSVPPNPTRPWNERIVLGCWATKYLPLCAKYLPSFPITHIGFSRAYSRQFLSVPNISFNILQRSIITPFFGARFIRDARAKGRPIFTWTVNDESMMRWSISKGLDGVITDDPQKFFEVCKDWEQGKRDIHISRREWLIVLWINLMVVIFGAIFYWKHGGIDKRKHKTIGDKKSQRAPSAVSSKSQ